MRPDKQKVVDEVWDDARIESFLHKGPMGDEALDYSLLLHAYRSMRVDDFARFLKLYTQAGYNLDARNRNGQSLSEVIADHAKAAPFIALLQQSQA